MLLSSSFLLKDYAYTSFLLKLTIGERKVSQYSERYEITFGFLKKINGPCDLCKPQLLKQILSFKLSKYEHIVDSFEACDLEISNM